MRYEVGMALRVEADNEEQAALVALQVERLRDHLAELDPRVERLHVGVSSLFIDTIELTGTSIVPLA